MSGNSDNQNSCISTDKSLINDDSSGFVASTKNIDFTEGTSLAPEGTSLAPEGTSLAPEGTSLAPEKTESLLDSQIFHCEYQDNTTENSDNEFLIDGIKYYKEEALSSGSEADMYIVNSDQGKFALKLYKKGHFPNVKLYDKLARLKGRNHITDLLSHGTVYGTVYELMPYFPLGSAASILAIRHNAKAVLNIVLNCATSLHECHKVGFVHLDVKPANILIKETNYWSCVLSDFGISEILDNGKALLEKQNRTPTYAAPEIYGNDSYNTFYYSTDNKRLIPITASADYFSLGMTAISLWNGESYIRKNQEKDMLLSKIAGSVSIPPDMPDQLKTLVSGLIMKDPQKRWGYKQIVDYIKGGEHISTVESDYFEFPFAGQIIAHTKEELAACMLNNINQARQYLYHGYLSDFFKQNRHNDWAVQMDEISERKFIKDQIMGVFASVHFLNPLYDISFNSKPKSDGYAMTLETIGKFLNQVYIWKYVEDGRKDNLAESYVQYELYDRIVASFRHYQDSYLQTFFLSKGTRFLQADKYCSRCISISHNQTRCAPKDSFTTEQIAFMQVIDGFDGAPAMKLKGDNTVFSTMEEFDSIHGIKAKSDSLNYGLKGWLAVQYFADPHKSMDKKYEFEKQVQLYVEKIGSIDRNSIENLKYEYAVASAKSILRSKRSKVTIVKAQGLIQTLFSVLLVFSPLLIMLTYYLGCAIEANKEEIFREMEYLYVFYGLALAIILYLLGRIQGCITPSILGALFGLGCYLLMDKVGIYSIWFFFSIVLIGIIYFAYLIFFKNKLNVNHFKAGFEELVLEPLDFAFGFNGSFDSSLNGLSSSLCKEKAVLSKRRRTIFASLIMTIAVIFGAASLPVSDNIDKKCDNFFEKISTFIKTNSQDEALQEMSNTK